ncbi:MAG: hypothetical protein ABIP95_15215 [Pelobium sp.]
MKNYIIIGLITAAFFSSCKKEPDAGKEETSSPDSPAIVVKEKAGFTAVFDDVQLLSSATGAGPSMGIADFMLETNDNLNIVYYTMTPLQQGDMYGYIRKTKNLKTKEIITLPQYADDLSSFSVFTIKSERRELLLQTFKPYSNFYTYAIGGRQQFSSSLEYGGDFDLNISQGNPIGAPDMGFYVPAMNIEGININDNGFGTFTLGTETPSYLTSIVKPIFYGISNSSKVPVIKVFLEGRTKAQGNSTSTMIRTDSALVYNVDLNKLSERTLVDKIPVSGFTAKNKTSTLRHYSTDGKIMGLLIKDEVTKNYWTLSYDSNTGKLSKGLNNASLDYSGDGSDIDLDEFGNIYYTGLAGNGTNDKGVSIYKKGIDGTISLIGSDDFLKFGEVIKLRILMGKVYFALKGRKTGTNYYQLSILKQN